MQHRSSLWSLCCGYETELLDAALVSAAAGETDPEYAELVLAAAGETDPEDAEWFALLRRLQSQVCVSV